MSPFVAADSVGAGIGEFREEVVVDAFDRKPAARELDRPDRALRANVFDRLVELCQESVARLLDPNSGGANSFVGFRIENAEIADMLHNMGREFGSTTGRARPSSPRRPCWCA